MTAPASVDGSVRDYAAEMRDAIVGALPTDGEYVREVEMAKLYARLRRTDPALLRGWLDMHAVSLMTDYAGTLVRRERAMSRARAGSRAFEEAAAAAEPGWQGLFAVPFVVNVDNGAKPLAEMTGADHDFVADGYQRTQRKAAFEEAFHRAVGKKVGKKQTHEVFTLRQIEEMYGSLVKRE